MKRYGLIGAKLGHSFSPDIHKLAMEKLGIKGRYNLIEVDIDQVVDVMDSIRVGLLDGVNVTIPYKVEVMKYLDEISEDARLIGAVNTVLKVDGRLVGHNTDYWGFRYTIEKIGLDLEDKIVSVLGAGGSARAVVKVLEDLGARVFLVSRDPKRAREEFQMFNRIEVINYEEVKDLDGELIVNTTPLGMYPNTASCAIDGPIIRRYKEAIDLIYNPQETLFLRRANSGENGLYMLVGQAIKAQEIWQGRGIEDFEDIYKKVKGIVYR